ncbi:hypothetical protein [Novipirellula caenicola]|uniref:Hydrogenase maturation protease n=1 Tax=Novipirellula caenicola TaxID=1536901 RepID=A0ABP9VX00_9BACT
MWYGTNKKRLQGAEPRRQVVLGLGSSHGDDQFGWTVIDELMQGDASDSLRKIRSPIDIVTWLDVDADIHIVDAVVGLPANVSLWRLDFANPDHRAQIQTIPAQGTHNLDLYEVLLIAESLGKSTDQVVLWLGRAETLEPIQSISPITRVAVGVCSTALKRRLQAS